MSSPLVPVESRVMRDSQKPVVLLSVVILTAVILSVVLLSCKKIAFKQRSYLHRAIFNTVETCQIAPTLESSRPVAECPDSLCADVLQINKRLF